MRLRNSALVVAFLLQACGSDDTSGSSSADAGDAGPKGPVGRVYISNPIQGSIAVVPLPDLTGTTALDGLRAGVQAAAPGGDQCATVRHAVPDANGNYLFSPSEGAMDDPFAEVQAYYHVTRTLDLFAGLGMPASAAVDVVVNVLGYPGTYAQDFCGRPAIVLGQLPATGGFAGLDFSYDGDVVCHETSHLAMQRIGAKFETFVPDELGLDHLPNSISEGYADYYAAILTDDPVLGDYVASAFPGGSDLSRDIGQNLKCPDDLQGEAHLDSRILSAAWLRLHKGGKVTGFDELVYQAAALSGANASIAATLTAILAAVKAANGEANAGLVQAEFDAAGLTSCTRIVPIAVGATAFGYIPERGMTSIADTVQVPGSLQHLVQVPSGVSSLKIEVTAKFISPIQGEIGSANAVVRVRRQTPIKYAWSGPSSYMLSADHEQDASMPLSIDSSSSPPLTPGPYYLQVSSPEPSNPEGPIRYTIHVTTTP